MHNWQEFVDYTKFDFPQSYYRPLKEYAQKCGLVYYSRFEYFDASKFELICSKFLELDGTLVYDLAWTPEQSRIYTYPSGYVHVSYKRRNPEACIDLGLTDKKLVDEILGAIK